jgi:hypothetical protein
MKNLSPWIKLWGLGGLLILSCAGPQKSSDKAFPDVLRQDLAEKGQELYQQQKWAELSEMLKDPRWSDCLSHPLCHHDWTLLRIGVLIRQENISEASLLWSSLRPELISGNFWSWLYLYEGTRLLASTNQVTKAIALIEEFRHRSDFHQWASEQKLALQLREFFLRSFVRAQLIPSKKIKKASPLWQKQSWSELFTTLSPSNLTPKSQQSLYAMMHEDLKWLGHKEASTDWTVRVWRVDSILRFARRVADEDTDSSDLLEFAQKEWEIATQEALLPTQKSLRNQRLLQLQALLDKASLPEASKEVRRVASQSSVPPRTAQLMTWMTQERKKLNKLLYSPVISPSSTRPWTEIYPNKPTDSNKSF